MVIKNDHLYTWSDKTDLRILRFTIRIISGRVLKHTVAKLISITRINTILVKPEVKYLSARNTEFCSLWKTGSIGKGRAIFLVFTHSLKILRDY